ncbi:MAG: AAA family ATPase, partial [Planctomycetota bacterium]
MTGSSDVRSMIDAAQNGTLDGITLQGKYASDAISEMFAVMQKLLHVRNVVLSVNRQYIKSAAMADSYRTEPVFKLQGSYRNMNRIAQRVSPVMNDEELQTLIVSNYEQDAQTLTTENESNILQFRGLMGIRTEEETKRWDEICYAFGEQQRLAGLDADDTAGRVLSQLSAMRDGLDSIRVAIETTALQATELPPPPLPDQKVLVQHRVPRVVLEMVQGQFQLMQHWLQPLMAQSLAHGQDLSSLKEQLEKSLELHLKVRDTLEDEKPNE